MTGLHVTESGTLAWVDGAMIGLKEIMDVIYKGLGHKENMETKGTYILNVFFDW